MTIDNKLTGTSALEMGSQIQYDAIDVDYGSLTEQQRELVEQARTAILRQKVITIKALSGAQCLSDISLGINVISETHQALTRNPHRNSRLQYHMDGLVDEAAEEIKAQIKSSESQLSPYINKSSTSLDMSRTGLWNRLTGSREE